MSQVDLRRLVWSQGRAAGESQPKRRQDRTKYNLYLRTSKLKTRSLIQCEEDMSREVSGLLRFLIHACNGTRGTKAIA